ncbi:hypothetical protein BST61_g2364 [Cercospora zeina]
MNSQQRGSKQSLVSLTSTQRKQRSPTITISSTDPSRHPSTPSPRQPHTLFPRLGSLPTDPTTPEVALVLLMQDSPNRTEQETLILPHLRRWEGT